MLCFEVIIPIILGVIGIVLASSIDPLKRVSSHIMDCRWAPQGSKIMFNPYVLDK